MGGIGVLRIPVLVVMVRVGGMDMGLGMGMGTLGRALGRMIEDCRIYWLGGCNAVMMYRSRMVICVGRYLDHRFLLLC